MKTYELIYIISPEISLEEAEAFAKEVEATIQQAGAIILKSEKPSAKTLSYSIKKQSSGFFSVLEFQSDESKIKEISQKLEKDNKVLRCMVSVKEPVKIHKERRTRKPLFTLKTEQPLEKKEESVKIEEKKPEEKKVELEDISKKLDEILGE